MLAATKQASRRTAGLISTAIKTPEQHNAHVTARADYFHTIELLNTQAGLPTQKPPPEPEWKDERYPDAVDEGPIDDL